MYKKKWDDSVIINGKPKWQLNKESKGQECPTCGENLLGNELGTWTWSEKEAIANGWFVTYPDGSKELISAKKTISSSGEIKTIYYHPRRSSQDHRIPRSISNSLTDDPENIRPMCMLCNKLKGNQLGWETQQRVIQVQQELNDVKSECQNLLKFLEE